MTNLDIPGLEKGDIEFAMKHINTLPKGEQLELLQMLDMLEKSKTIEKKQTSFLEFAQAMDPNFIVGEHHKIIARAIEKIASGELKRVIINIAPRHGKSHIMSYLFPAWFMGKFPDKKVIMASHTADLAVDFGRKVRNLVADPAYKEVFSEVTLQADSKASGRWGTNHGGEYYACGVGGALAGRGAHLCLGENTIIKVDDEEITIKDVRVGQRIATPTGWEVVTKKKLTTHQSKVIVNTSIEASHEHPFNTTRGWVHAGDIQIGDKLKTLTIWRSTWLRLNQITSTLLKTLHEKLGKV